MSGIITSAHEGLISEGYELVTDTFGSVHETSAFKHTDLSSLSGKEFTKEDAMDFIYSPSKINANYSEMGGVLGIFDVLFFMPDG